MVLHRLPTDYDTSAILLAVVNTGLRYREANRGRISAHPVITQLTGCMIIDWGTQKLSFRFNNSEGLF